MSDPGSVKKVCVIGAGTMGSGIAAHLANLGFQVTLLDATAQTVTEAFNRAKAARPPLFYLPERAAEIRLGNTADNLAWVSEADWVCEAIPERQGVKRSLYSRIDLLLKPDAMISTNTSGLEIEKLADDRSDSFQQRFVGTHFFNPPRFMKLLELIPTSKTDPSTVATMVNFLENKVARRVVVAKDTPGFIANRYGMWCLFHAIHVAERLHFSVEQVDAITGLFLGRPKSATFRLCDIVGLDVMRDIAANMIERVPADPHMSTYDPPRSMVSLLARNWIGDKAGQGYYRREGREWFVLDLGTLAYRQAHDVDLPSIEKLQALPLIERIDKALELRDETGEFLRHYLLPALKYADYLKDEISHSGEDIDHVMRWGFGWQIGPFEIIDALGSVRTGVASGPFYKSGSVRTSAGTYRRTVHDPRYATIEDFKVTHEAPTYRLRDMGDGVTAVCITTKMGIISPALLDDLTTLFESGKLDRVVLTSEARSFSAGFDLKFLRQSIEDERWIEIDQSLQKLQKLGELLEGSRAVAAIFGHALGAGLELALSTSQIVTLVETQIGFPEARLGLLPAGRGTTMMRLYNQHTAKRLSEVAYNLATGAASDNADAARVLGYLRSADLTVRHPDCLLFEVKKAALEAKPVERPKVSTAMGPLSGMIDRLLEVGVSRGELTAHDELIGQKMKLVISKATSYEDCLTRERIEFLDLCSNGLTQARISHMLANGSALRN